MKSMANRMKAAVTPVDKFAAAEAAMATGTLQTAANVVSSVQLTSTVPQSSALFVPGSRVTRKESAGDSAIIRETFSLPPSDSALIDQLRQRSAAQGVMLNRSEILRAGLAALNMLPDSKLVEISNLVPKMKTGRPKLF
ncbi:hypothetical protein [Giesbergeria anulus]|uniref:Uncharacterized protein n=1 Tax=Giesbergeria anulus TaxID=180197 RepID=A0A1H9SLZ2_9BURK|nr:hypothetical protein [Giesbergeria anulus]SER86022.1 hypothetical protein SAMN02982919_03170 [Giesbergeria anulus]